MNTSPLAAIAASGFIANTDFGWFSHFLHRTEPPEEVNFWQPSPHGFLAISGGSPFFFRLGSPIGRSPATAFSRATSASPSGLPGIPFAT